MSQYDKVNKTFEHAVKLLQENLQFLADSNKVSPKFIALQNNIIKAIITYQHQTETIICSLESDLFDISVQHTLHAKRWTENKHALEAICLIHGITDLPAWLSKGRAYLVQTAVEMNRDRTMQLSAQFMELIEQLNEQDREQLLHILQKPARERAERELEELRSLFIKRA